MIRWGLFILGLLATAWAVETWEVVRVGRVDYVSLDSFAKFYGFKVPQEIEGNHPFELSSAGGALQLTLDSREMRWKGVRYWLSHSVRKESEVVLIPRVDLVKTFDPLLRPNGEIPRRPLQGVVVDPGHGGGDEGTRAARGLSEKTANFDVAKRLVRCLDKAGIPWVLTRTQDRYVDHADRSKLADDHPGYIFVSIHFNEDSSRSSEGWETYSLSPQYAPSTSSGGSLVGDEDQIWPGNAYDHHNFLLTQAIHRSAVLAKSNAPSDRGVKRARFKVLRLANSPSVLVEGGFMSNPREASLLRTEEYRQQVAEWIFAGIQAYARSQENPQAAARLQLAKDKVVTNAVGTLVGVKKNEEVAPFRPRATNLSVSNVAPAIAVPTSGQGAVVAPAAVGGRELEVRKALPVGTEKKE
ncbi:MAG: N-acetylmuramoyl-L-alanine amidase [Verrucomicrobia bacterium]|nr:N-acetylmuramoyl-L-alanine amidase [Verrucomicrobiota bacterium]